MPRSSRKFIMTKQSHVLLECVRAVHRSKSNLFIGMVY